MSGLKMNLEKTKVVWIGKKKFSQDTMCIKWGLEWGSSRFTLLGIKFSVDLYEMEKLNYEPKFKEFERTIKFWSTQNLSPIGKITVIKTLIISKLNHLFITLPSPNNILLNQFINKLFGFIWNEKPDKIKRNSISQSYELGGLKMIDVKQYIKSLKLTWIRRMIRQTSNYSTLLLSAEGMNIIDLIHLGPSKKVNNPFWQEVFNAWSELQNKVTVKNNDDFFSCNIWKNKEIKVGNQTLFYREWTIKGIWIVNDLLNEEGHFMKYEEFQNTYHINTNFLRYQSLISAVKSFMKRLDIRNDSVQKIYGPVIPSSIKIFLKSVKGSKDMYRILNYKKPTITPQEKWLIILNKNFIPWRKIYRLPYNITKNTRLQWLQYRIAHRILGTNEFLFKIKIKQSNKCEFCKDTPETIEHIFWTCPKIIDLWENLNNWIYTMTQIELPLNMCIVLFGIIETNERNYIRNLIILITKYYIYRCKMSCEQVNIFALKNYLKENLTIEKFIFNKNNTLEKVDNCWNPWTRILE